MDNSNFPLAITGMACHFPGGVHNLEDYWNLLKNRRSGIGKVPSNRWNWKRYTHPDRSVPGRMVSQYGGFVDGVDMFDAAFFDISPREAKQMDPQQRLLLTTAWETLEDSGTALRNLRGKDVGVFVGISAHDFSDANRGDLSNMDMHSGSGSAFSIAANRLSYFFDLRGPSVALDTACSSALVATALACNSIWSGESSAALAGGVNLLLSPITAVGLSQAGMLSVDGQCYTFDHRANGYVRGEGVGMILIKPLEQAIAEGDRIYALIRRATLNQDGRSSSMTVPNLDAQEAMLQTAYEGFDVNRLAYFEAHGTGTPVGDPIEARAVGQAIGRQRGEPCLIGSVKTNIGHLESASGAAGLIKGALVLHHGEIPPQLNFERPNPHIPLDELNIKVVAETHSLPKNGSKPPLVGVNSFGFGGANAHIVLEQYRPAKDLTPQPRKQRGGIQRKQEESLYMLPISAKSEQALLAQAANYQDYLRHTGEDISVITTGAGLRREHLPYRLAVIGRSREELREELRDYLNNPQAGQTGYALEELSQPVFVFAGQGAQWWGMGQQLLQEEPVYRNMVEQIDALLEPLAGWSLLEEVTQPEHLSRIDNTKFAQPAIFALQVGLVALWEHWGVRPVAVFGHSIGEVAAAYTAGILSLEDAVRVIVYRSRFQHTTRGQGAMGALGLSVDEVTGILADYEGRVGIAATNSPTLITISGDKEAIAEIVENAGKQGTFTRLLPIDYAFHSHQMDGIETMLKERLADIQPQAGDIPFVSTVTGQALAGEELTADYWWQNVRQPVQFFSAVKACEQAGHRTYLEIGPHPSLRYALQDSLQDEHKLFHSLHQEKDEYSNMLENVAALYVNGRPVDWKHINRGAGQYINLPTYPWQHQHFTEVSLLHQREDLDGIVHPLLGVPQYGPQASWRNVVDPRVIDYLPDHQIMGAILMPGAAFLEMGLAVTERIEGDTVLEDIHIEQGLFISTEQLPTVEISVNEREQSVKIASTLDDGESWTHHVLGTLRKRGVQTPPPVDVDGLKTSLDALAVDGPHAQMFKELGYDFGPSFLLIREAWAGVDETLARVDGSALNLDDYHAHPALLDTGFQAAILSRPVMDALKEGGSLFLPERIGRLQLFAKSLPAWMYVYARLVEQSPESVVADVFYLDEAGHPLGIMQGTRLDRVDAQKKPFHYHHLEWEVRRLKERPIRTPLDVPSPLELMQAGFEQDLPVSEHSRRSEEAAFQELIMMIAHHTFLELGWDYQAGERFSLDDIMRHLGIVERYRPQVQFHLENLAEAGYLESLSDLEWRVAQSPEFPDRESVLAKIHAYPVDIDKELSLQIFDQLSRIYRGLVDPLSVLFPGGSSGPMRRIYRKGDTLLHPYAIIRGVLKAMDRPLRVLEIGAGTGALTMSILPDPSLDYTFSDVTHKFLNEGRQLFGTQPGMDYQIVDITRPIKGYYDVILAANVIHGVEDPLYSLELLRESLAPGGALILLELVRRDIPITFTFGILPEWWRWNEAQQQYGLAIKEPDEWLSLLEQAGFADAVSLEQLSGDTSQLHSIIAARAPLNQIPDMPPTTGQFVIIGEFPELVERLGDADLTILEFGEALPEFENPDEVTVICIEPDILQALHLAQTCDAGRVIIVARDIQYVTEGDTCTGLDKAGLVGLLRVVRMEYSHSGWQVIDLGLDGTVDDVLAELHYPDGEQEVAYRNGQRYIQRLHQTNVDEWPRYRHPSRSYGLLNKNPGTFSSLHLSEVSRQTPAPDEVEIQVKAAGINFRDVMKVLGMYPGTPEEIAIIGNDCAGIVTAVGEEVSRFQPGDEVFGIAEPAFCSYATSYPFTFAKKPASLSFEDAAAIPVIFLTAYHALVNLARMQPGERILIHAATGGVGQAAIQIARDIGLEIYATAGTPEKRAMLREQGIEHVFSSRTLDFADQIMDVTEGKGMDAVLNSLAGDFIPKSLSVLAMFGRFLEIGKIDLYDNSLLGMEALKNSVSFMVFDLEQILWNRTPEFVAMLEAVRAKFEAGVYQPIPCTVYDISEAEETFRTIAAGKHVGKNVFRIREEALVTPNMEDGHLFRPDASYLITGGGGFGLETARWMVQQGARHLVLMSRSGVQDEEALRQMEAAGAKVLDARGDVTNMEDVQRIIEGIEPPLAGVFHAAVVYNDKFLHEMDEENFLQGYNPKVCGAWNLHQATLDMPLDHFICYSSALTVSGNIKQANYTAANIYLENLAYYRRARGLPALTINWGGFEDTGIISRDSKIMAYIEAIGFPAMHSADALHLLGKVLALDITQIYIAEADWDVLRTHASSRILEYLGRKQDVSAGQGMFSARVRSAPVEERLDMVEQFLIQTAANILGLEPDRIDPMAGFSTFGLDSMMAIEMTNTLSTQLGFSLPVSNLLTRSNIHDLAALILRQIESHEDAEAEAALDLWAEAQLPPDIHGGQGAVATKIRHILLTGATGFLGAYLLAEILNATDVDVACLVRAESEAAAMQRIQDNLRCYGLWSDGFEGRVQALSGDISLPMLGLDEATFNKLAGEIDAIYHNAAELHLTKSYSDLKASNVLSVQEILRLAGRKRIKHVHYVSTIAVFFGPAYSSEDIITEADSPDPEGLHGGYVQSKWVAEQLIGQAQKREIPCTIYRPGVVTGDSRTGMTNINDLSTRILKGSYQVGFYPETGVDMHLVPVDYVSKALVHISLQAENAGQIFHLISPQAIQVNNLIAWGRKVPDMIEAVPYSDWYAQIFQQGNGDNALLPLMPLFPPEQLEAAVPVIRCDNTLRRLDGSGIECPPMDATLVVTYEQFLLSSGYIELRDGN